jgi:hypothetical protein
MRHMVCLILSTVALMATGCVGMTATPAVQGKAYVVKGSMFGTSMYNCEARNGEPVCWEVEQVENE